MMLRRIVDGLLTIALVAGGIWAWMLNTERNHLQATYNRLNAAAGELEVADPALLTLRAIPHQPPLHFAWRAHIPPGRFGFGMKSTRGSISGFGLPSTRPEEVILRVNCREARDSLDVYIKGVAGSTRTTMGDQTMRDFLRGRWDQLIVEQAGATKLLAVDPLKPLTFLKLSIPPSLLEEAKARLSPQSQALLPVILEVKKP